MHMMGVLARNSKSPRLYGVCASGDLCASVSNCKLEFSSSPTSSLNFNPMARPYVSPPKCLDRPAYFLHAAKDRSSSKVRRCAFLLSFSYHHLQSCRGLGPPAHCPQTATIRICENSYWKRLVLHEEYQNEKEPSSALGRRIYLVRLLLLRFAYDQLTQPIALAPKRSSSVYSMTVSLMSALAGLRSI
ncbi:MAG: hypothetical protein QOE37_2265 [Microbacteriaceae bacterium]|nr:hypothetical protein [Microbacteriaceae bacterium]